MFNRKKFSIPKRLIVAVEILLIVLLVQVERPAAALAGPSVYASPLHGGCYQVRPDRCKIHLEPFSIALAPGTSLVRFQVTAINAASGKQTIIYDFRPDLSNPPSAFFGSTYTPTSVAKDFAAICSNTYTVSLQGQDSGDGAMFNLGQTGQFTCPVGVYRIFAPRIGR